ncbi:Imm8 family immunity protein [Lysobacter enzymogenes]|uniref:Imm8 family immunity protein n=2 Tax=Lysobacter enzymogenes TaxID=69 RepID=UPI001AF59F37|nr:Imm8 family immunity protein [Lysobacter enzymogenes]QQQ00765.1 hypothetical protein JHW41_22280 [Lysobacter enzymogenes]
MTIVLKIRSCYSPDVDDLPGWVPASVDEVYYPLEMEIGEADRSGAHVFGLMIATPQGLAKHHRGRALQAFRNNQARTPGMGRKALLVIDPYRWSAVRERIDQQVQDCQRESWEASLACLREAFFWEYEGVAYRR